MGYVLILTEAIPSPALKRKSLYGLGFSGSRFRQRRLAVMMCLGFRVWGSGLQSLRFSGLWVPLSLARPRPAQEFMMYDAIGKGCNTFGRGSQLWVKAQTSKGLILVEPKHLAQRVNPVSVKR